MKNEKAVYALVGVNELANSIIYSQGREITQMEAWNFSAYKKNFERQEVN